MFRAFVAASCILLAALPARGDIESARVRAGLAAYGRLQYERAASLLESALGESLTREEKIATWRTLGFCHLAVDHPDEARRDFERLLTIDSAIELDVRVSPRVRAVFEEARAALAHKGQQAPPVYRLPEVHPLVEPAAPREGEPITLTLEHRGGLARRAELFYRTGRTGRAASFARTEAWVDGAGRVRLLVPGIAVRPPTLDYYAMLLDESGAAVARAGSLATPLELSVQARPVPLHKRRWFWGVIGGAAGLLIVGAVTTAAVLSSPATITITPR
jgi:hypothetical protein